MHHSRFLNIRTYIFAVLSSLLVGLSGCGGGGGGGGTASVSYSGLTSKTVLTTTSADDMTVGSFQNGTISQSSGSIASLSQATGTGGSKPRGLILADAIEHALKQADISSHTETTTIAAAIQTASDSVAGTCGGVFSFSITFDDVTGNFSGTGNFSNYCEADTTLNGSITFSGVINTSTLEFGQFDISTNGLTTQACGDTFTVSGTLSLTVSGLDALITMDMRTRDDASGVVYWVNNLQMNIIDGAGYVDVSITGRYYDPAYGYADISTTTPLRVLDSDVWPSSGVLVATGDIGIASGATSAQLTAFPASYTIEADTTGNGSFDFSDTVAWPADLCSF